MGYAFGGALGLGMGSIVGSQSSIISKVLTETSLASLMTHDKLLT